MRDLFDINRDGDVDTFEKAIGLAAFATILDEEEDTTELELSGLDVDELEFMEAEERRQVLEDAGLDPDEYDF